jgi:Ran GTPase-activating protein (RanGAP) involved in mRNA processing and transport
VYLENIESVNKLLLADIFTTRKEDIGVSCELIVQGFANKGLRLFDISNNALCPDGCLIIGKLFKTNPGIKYLWLNHVAFSRDGTEYISKAITDAKLDLVSLQVNKNRMGEKGHFFGKMLNSQKNLTDLVLYQNDLRDVSMKENCAALKNMSSLISLDISDNFFDDSSFDAFCESLVHLKGLKELNMSDCNISPEMTKRFIPILHSFAGISEVEKFYFNYNEVEEEDLEAFFAAVAQFKHLKKVECKVEIEEDMFEGIRDKFEGLGDEDCVLESEDDMDASIKSETEEDKKIKEEQEFQSLMSKLESFNI